MYDKSRAELERLMEEAKRNKQVLLAKMTPEERALAEQKAKEAIETDWAALERMVAEAAALAKRPAPHAESTSQAAAPGASGFCSYCGASAEGGKFCTNCGKPLNQI